MTHRRAKKPQTGYMHRLLAARFNGSLPDGVFATSVQHDNWCQIYQGRACTCVPDITAVDGDTVVTIDESGVGTLKVRS
jgi:hypothetical protein